MNIRKCSNCESTFLPPVSNKAKKFCCQSCAASHNNQKRIRSESSKEKCSITLKGKKRPWITRWPRTPVTLVSCSCCQKIFWSKSSNRLRKTCSPECARINSTYRKIVHEYKHNDETILLESKWEVEIANWLDANNVQWTRPDHLVWYDSSGKLRRYFPDFYLPDYDIYLDPKNDYQITISTDKLSNISKQVNLLYGSVEYLISSLMKIMS